LSVFQKRCRRKQPRRSQATGNERKGVGCGIKNFRSVCATCNQNFAVIQKHCRPLQFVTSIVHSANCRRSSGRGIENLGISICASSIAFV
jgi:hypothetical protein